ncbi:hypothetical protein ISF_09337 [Cordyceps fumosorosea ARSEF 2679]|uniref:Uncharacterized protein n=1 Tax=Cordyceps fumosorosea (strain ARSEF 2679) TaxID=1081104 RepID=A0A167JT62_CORFA|nr:hypothetical protein ISF_09337 [Cordyceps fumosorosea ARSEF 2679]OAA50719.1 hypothetical protein ISF_09337 [Cordyceps fumosorosea ARSEF 2679]
MDFTASSTGSTFLISGYEDESLETAKPLLGSPAIGTLPVPFGAGGSADVLVAAPPTVFQDRMISPQLSASPPSTGLVDHLATKSMAILALSQSVREAVPVYLEVYWNKVHPMYPIIHRPTFDKAIESTSEVLDTLKLPVPVNGRSK